LVDKVEEPASAACTLLGRCQCGGLLITGPRGISFSYPLKNSIIQYAPTKI